MGQSFQVTWCEIPVICLSAFVWSMWTSCPRKSNHRLVEPCAPQVHKEQVKPVILISYSRSEPSPLQVWALSISLSPLVLYHKGKAAGLAPADQGLLGHSCSEMTHNMKQGDRLSLCLFAGKHKLFYLQDIYWCNLFAGREANWGNTHRSTWGNTTAQTATPGKARMLASHISPNRRGEKSYSSEEHVHMSKVQQSLENFDTESHDWRVGGQRKSAFNSHWLSTWLRHTNVLHTVWKPPLFSAL